MINRNQEGVKVGLSCHHRMKIIECLEVRVSLLPVCFNNFLDGEKGVFILLVEINAHARRYVRCNVAVRVVERMPQQGIAAKIRIASMG